jgi:hypothetical protein
VFSQLVHCLVTNNHTAWSPSPVLSHICTHSSVLMFWRRAQDVLHRSASHRPYKLLFTLTAVLVLCCCLAQAFLLSRVFKGCVSNLERKVMAAHELWNDTALIEVTLLLCRSTGFIKYLLCVDSNITRNVKGQFTHSMPRPCRSHAMPFVNSHIPCRAPAMLRQCRVLRESLHGSRKYPNC